MLFLIIVYDFQCCVHFVLSLSAENTRANNKQFSLTIYICLHYTGRQYMPCKVTKCMISNEIVREIMNFY